MLLPMETTINRKVLNSYDTKLLLLITVYLYIQLLKLVAAS